MEHQQSLAALELHSCMPALQGTESAVANPDTTCKQQSLFFLLPYSQAEGFRHWQCACLAGKVHSTTGRLLEVQPPSHPAHPKQHPLLHHLPYRLAPCSCHLSTAGRAFDSTAHPSSMNQVSQACLAACTAFPHQPEAPHPPKLCCHTPWQAQWSQFSPHMHSTDSNALVQQGDRDVG